MTDSNFNKYGLAQTDGTAFVMATREIEDLMARTGGDPRARERELGWPEGFLDKHNVLRVDIQEPREFNLRVPSGNEAGANEMWIPGGSLPGGLSEAVIDGADIPRSGYDITKISEGED